MNLSNELLLLSLTDFYKESNNMSRFIKIIDGTSNISLRLIDWYITNYCKNNNEFFYCPDMKTLENHGFINIYASYRSQLKAYKKVKFDPFRRRERIEFYYDNDSKSICTTIGQLNFFRWAFEYSILNHIEHNIIRLERLMLTTSKHQVNIVKNGNIKDLQCESHLIKNNRYIVEKKKTIIVNFN